MSVTWKTHRAHNVTLVGRKTSCQMVKKHCCLVAQVSILNSHLFVIAKIHVNKIMCARSFVGFLIFVCELPPLKK